MNLSNSTLFRYAFEINYFGKNYVGWQIQPNGKSIEGEIESMLSRLHGDTEIKIIGCGRTDAGVHAHHYVFHVDLPPISDFNQFIYKLNKMLSDNISVLFIKQVSNDFHARFQAKHRTYRYFLHTIKDPFIEEQSYYFNHKIEVEKMNLASKFLLGTKDFACFSKTVTNENATSISTITSAQWIQICEGKYYFEISADRFLRNMVRAIVGTLLDVGLGLTDVENLEQIIKSKSRGNAGKSVAAHGLFLWEIKY